MTWNLPTQIEIDGVVYKITKNCDYRVVLDVICALNDEELDYTAKVQCALLIFYDVQNLSELNNIEQATIEMFKIINYGKEEHSTDKPQLMDWEHDFPQIAPPVSRVLGYDVRTPDKYTHWYTFLGGYMEIGECTFSTIVGIRNKKVKHKKLEKWEEEYYRENYRDINLPNKISAEEQELLDSDW